MLACVYFLWTEQKSWKSTLERAFHFVNKNIASNVREKCASLSDLCHCLINYMFRVFWIDLFDIFDRICNNLSCSVVYSERQRCEIYILFCIYVLLYYWILRNTCKAEIIITLNNKAEASRNNCMKHHFSFSFENIGICKIISRKHTSRYCFFFDKIIYIIKFKYKAEL